MITLKSLIDQTDFNDVWNCFARHYKVKNEHSYSDYKNFYEKLLKMTPNKNIDNMLIYITVFQEDEDGEMYHTNDFDEENDALAFEVMGGYENDEIPYGIEACSFESWLDFHIDKQTLEGFTKPNIIAHCLFEMTYFGLEQRRDENGYLIVD